MFSKKKPGKSADKELVQQMKLAIKVSLALIEPEGLDVDAIAAKLGVTAAVIEGILLDLQEARYEMKSLDSGKGKRWKATGETVGLLRRLKASYRDPDEPPKPPSLADTDPETRRKLLFTGRLLGRKKDGKPLNLIERNLVASYEMIMPAEQREEIIELARAYLGPKWDDPPEPYTQEDLARELELAGRRLDPAVRKEAEQMAEELLREQRHQGPVHVKGKGKKELEVSEWLQSLSSGDAKGKKKK